MKKQKQLQQGDVLLTRITKSALEGAVKMKRDPRGIILAEGEKTGHFHGIEETDAELYKLGEKMLLANTKPVKLKHQEHGTITIEPGIWEVGGVREYDYLKQIVRKVVD